MELQNHSLGKTALFRELAKRNDPLIRQEPFSRLEELFLLRKRKAQQEQSNVCQ
jgi:hypothetical protein